MATLLGGIGPGRAQSVDCEDLRAELAASANQAARAGQFASALGQRRSELESTRDYAASIGCNAGLFDDGPPQCDDLSERIDRLQDDIELLQQRSRSAAPEDGGRRQALTEQYDRLCKGSATTQDGGFGLPSPTQPPQTMPAEPEDAPPGAAVQPNPAEPAPPRLQQTTTALCVRHCDGGFFPITDQARPDDLEGLGSLCQALCPNTEASLYTTPSGGIETAVGPDGASYTALPAAFRYQKTYDASCSCKPPHQSWAEALAGAERLLEANKGDVIVTQQMSDAMSHPMPPAVPAPKTATAPTKRAARNKPRNVPEITVPNPPSEDFGSQAGGNAGEEIMRQLRRAEPTL